MTREKAARQAEKRWGKKACWQVGQSLSSPEQRQTASAAVREARAEMERLDREMRARLQAEPWYQEYDAARKVQREIVKAHEGHCGYFRFTVGLNQGWCFEIKGQGDTWEEAFRAADEAARRSA